MSRLADIREQDATGKAADIFAGIKKAMGKVPNAYLTIGGHSPAALQQALAHNAMLHKGSLSAQQLEAINLSVSEATGCDYCLAAHTLMAKKPASAASRSMPCAAGSMRKRRSLMRW
ncbi:Macrophage infectivity potentiator-related protein [Klebsiella pneumoniae IS46]|nr:Macrophage infectivity potentiator-related protein [Klebsiella pneumoniae IS46]